MENYFSCFTYEVRSLTIIKMLIFIVELKIGSHTHSIIINYLLILTLYYFVGFKFSHALKK